MEKIIFEDLPSTKTPLNAENLNQIQNNAENAITEVDNKFNYSSEEKVIGTLFGKPLYRQMTTFNTINLGSSEATWGQQLPLNNIDSIFLDTIHSYWINLENGERFPIPYVNNAASAFLGHFFSMNNGVPTFNVRKSQNVSVDSILIIIEYTKTTD